MKPIKFLSKRSLRLSLFLSALLIVHCMGFAAEPWQNALAKMPLRTNVVELNKTNCVPLLLSSFQQNELAKALIFMPGATDEFYFYNRGLTRLTNTSPTLLDAVNALTNQSLIRVTFRSPFLLLHTDEDPLEPLYKVEHQPTADRIKKKKFLKHVTYNDRDWEFLHPTLTFELNTKFLPPPGSPIAYHFFRHSFTAWNLSGLEMLEAMSLADKTIFTIEKGRVIFEADLRTPKAKSP